MVLSVSATGILNCAALLFLPAILAVLVVASSSSALGASPAVLATVLLPAVVVALALGRWAAARLGTSRLELEIEAPGAGMRRARAGSGTQESQDQE